MSDVPQALIEPMKPLTVIQVDHPLSDEEAQNIHEHFRGAVHDDRPVIVIGPNVHLMMLEPYQTISRRAWLAFALAVAALIISILLILWVLVL